MADGRVVKDPMRCDKRYNTGSSLKNCLRAFFDLLGLTSSVKRLRTQFREDFFFFFSRQLSEPDAFDHSTVVEQ